MVSEAERKLYGMMEIAEQHQHRVEAACQALEVQRAALVAERAALESEREAWRREVRFATQAEVKTAIEEAREQASMAMRVAVSELETSLMYLPHYAGQAQGALERIVSWAQWRILVRGLAVLMSLAVVMWVLGGGISAWTAMRVGALNDQRDALQAEIAQLKANYAEWKDKGVLQKLQTCGPKYRSCIAVDENAGTYGRDGDFRIIKGY